MSGRFVVASLVLGCALLSAVGVPAGADPAGRLEVTGHVLRGYWTTVDGSALTPDTVYSLTAGSGSFADPDGPVDSVTTDDAGRFWIDYHADPQTPFDITAVHVTADGSDGSSASVDIPLTRPDGLSTVAYAERICPAAAVTMQSSGFPDGTYAVSSRFFRTASSVAPVDGTVTLAGTVSDDAPATFPVTLTAPDAARTELALSMYRDTSWAQDMLDDNPPWTKHSTADCFRPGERVDLHPLDSASAAVKVGPPHPPVSSVVADAHGNINVRVGATGTAQPSRPAGVRATGAQSGQTVRLYAPALFGSTLSVGKRLTVRRGGVEALSSVSGRYHAVVMHCVPTIDRYFDAGGGATSWQAPTRSDAHHDCNLSVGTDGNLVLRGDDGHRVWQAQTAGTGAHNRLTMRDDGVLALYTGAGTAVWSSALGSIRTPESMVTGQTLRRGQWLRDGATKFGLRPNGNVGVYRSGKRIWSSHTTGKGGYTLRLEKTASIVLRNRKGHVVWSSPWRNSRVTSHLYVTASGDVRIRDVLGNLAWHTRTGR